MMNYGQKCRSLVFENLNNLYSQYLEDTGGALKQWKI
jgi:hypothetical protein